MSYNSQPETICIPDLSGRPLQLTVERVMEASPETLYLAWTEQFDRWFAEPGSVLIRAEVNAPFYFETVFQPEGADAPQRNPHYGRFLRLQPDRLIELTWVTCTGGTEGAETVVTVELTPHESGSRLGSNLRLRHAGFFNEASRDRHLQAWPWVLDQLNQRMRVMNVIEENA
jgi:uncharacterized protein YndB with AHSA1/START domain